MINHLVKVYPSKIKLKKQNQLAWKIAEIASDNAKLDKNSTDIDRLNRLVLDIYSQIGKSSPKNNVIISQKK